MAVVRDVIVEQSGEDVLQGMRVSWGGIISGVLVVLGTLILLTALGIAIGISATDPGATDASRIGTGAAIWSGLSLLIALFLGGLASTRLGMVWEKTTGIVQGALVWVLAMLLMLFLAANGIGMVVGGAFGMAQSAAQGAAGGAMQGSSQLATLGSGSPDQIAQRLRDPQTASTIASLTGRPQAEVQQRLQTTAANVEAARDNPEQARAALEAGTAQFMDDARRRMTETAQAVKPEATMGAWVTFFALLLSLAAAMIGSAVGRRKAADRVTDPVRTMEDLTRRSEREEIDRPGERRTDRV